MRKREPLHSFFQNAQSVWRKLSVLLEHVCVLKLIPVSFHFINIQEREHNVEKIPVNCVLTIMD